MPTEWTTAQTAVYEHILSQMLEQATACDVALDGIHTFKIPYRNHTDDTKSEVCLVIEVQAEPITTSTGGGRMLEWTLLAWTTIPDSTVRIPSLYGPYVTTNSIRALDLFTQWARQATC